MKTDPTCPTGKRRYLTFTHATHDAVAMRHNGKRATARAYHCPTCSGFHVGGTI